MHECDQVSRIDRIEDDILNHRKWREGVSTQLSTIEVAIATLNERLKAKVDTFDKHVGDEHIKKIDHLEQNAKDTVALKVGLVLTLIGMMGSVFTGIYAYGGMAKQVEISAQAIERISKGQ